MNIFLLKTDPETYSIYDLEKEKQTVWDGVHNYQAIGIMKTMKIGDFVYIYHSQKEKQILGTATIISSPQQNHADKRYSWVVEIKFLGHLKNPVSLADLKAIDSFKDFLLIRNSRLSVMPVPQEVHEFIQSKQ